MDVFNAIRQFFRDNPRMWAALAFAVVALVVMVWATYGGVGVGIGRFFAAGTPGDFSFEYHATPTDPSYECDPAVNTGSNPADNALANPVISFETTNIRNNDPDRTLHLVVQAFHSDSPACGTQAQEGEFDLTIDGNQDIPSGGTGQVIARYTTSMFTCGSVRFVGGFRFLNPGGGHEATGRGYSVQLSYGRDCAGGGGTGGGGGGTPAPGPHTPSQLVAQCGTTQNVLTWTLPSNHDSNALIKTTDGGSGVFIGTTIGANATTFTDTNVQPGHVYTYRHKAFADQTSNTVTCPTSAGPPTPLPSSGLCTQVVTRGGGTCPDPGSVRALCHTGCENPYSVEGRLASFDLDKDPVSELLYNIGSGNPADHRTWQWFRSPKTPAGWCTEEDGAWEAANRTSPPAQRPTGVASIRCPDGSSGGIDYSAYPNCGPAYTTTETVPCASAVPTPVTTATPPANLGPLSCAPLSQTVALNQPARLAAVGGSGIYQWGVTGGGIVEEGGGNAIAISYPTLGTKSVRVSSGGLSAVCVVLVQAATPLPSGATGAGMTVQKLARNMTRGDVTPVENVTIGAGTIVQFVITVRATGTQPLNNLIIRDAVPPGMSYQTGSTYVEGQRIALDTITTSGLPLGALQPGDSFTARWSAAADRTGQLPAGYQQVNPIVQVTATETGSVADDVTLQILGTGTGVVIGGVTPVPGATGPGAVQTGPGDAVILALMVASALTLLYTAYTRSSAFRRKEAEKVSRDQGPLDFRS